MWKSRRYDEGTPYLSTSTTSSGTRDQASGDRWSCAVREQSFGNVENRARQCWADSPGRLYCNLQTGRQKDRQANRQVGQQVGWKLDRRQGRARLGKERKGAAKVKQKEMSNDMKEERGAVFCLLGKLGRTGRQKHPETRPSVSGTWIMTYDVCLGRSRCRK